MKKFFSKVIFHAYYNNFRGCKMQIILLGAPGAGKGTQAQFISKKFNIPQISTGDKLRAAVKEGTEVGLKAKKLMDAGELVSDEIILDLVQERISQADCKNGFLFDGFPRTINQAKELSNRGITIDFVVEINVDDDEIITRMSGRRVHQASGRTYHVKFNPPKIENVDDETGEPLIQRDDDQEETVKKRLKIYHESTFPLVEYYESMSSEGKTKYVKIDGVGQINEIQGKITENLAK